MTLYLKKKNDVAADVAQVGIHLHHLQLTMWQTL